MVRHLPERALGECLAALIPDTPPWTAEETYPEGFDLAGLAAATPFVRRMRALGERLTQVEALTLASAVTVMATAAPTGHVYGSIARGRGFHGYMALIGGTATVLDLHEDAEGAHHVLPGPEPDLAQHHPLAVWGEALLPLLLCDPVDIIAADTHTRGGLLKFLPIAVFELVMHAREAHVRTVVDRLLTEASELNRLYPCPGGWSRSRVTRYLNIVLALLVEMGVTTWDGDRDGTVACTPLGLFGNVLLKASLHGPWPELEQQLTDAGYARCGEGYVNLTQAGMSNN